ncbi:protein of unknown function [Blastococcus saxobsidens DD2]|uniref:Uncharacterized protein n=1 Tax=Blastococcus saxobsidens (strain DD2) TaxID=1146883 RepID=H6RSH5_BLASD|nr:protein of unknown function [Blastococcus saxobsidens DD2]
MGMASGAGNSSSSFSAVAASRKSSMTRSGNGRAFWNSTFSRSAWSIHVLNMLILPDLRLLGGHITRQL